MKLRPKIATHDYETKKGHILRFLKQGQKVKVTIMFRGREMAHPERGEALLRKVADEIAEFGTIEQQPEPGGAQHDDGAGPGAARPRASRSGPPSTAKADAAAARRTPQPPARRSGSARRRRARSGARRRAAERADQQTATG